MRSWRQAPAAVAGQSGDGQLISGVSRASKQASRMNQRRYPSWIYRPRTHGQADGCQHSARRLSLTVYDSRQETVGELAALGARAAGSPKEVAEASDIVATAVVDDAQVEVVVTGPGGVLEGARSGTIIAIHSTISPETARRLAAVAGKKASMSSTRRSAAVKPARATNPSATWLAASKCSSSAAERCSSPRRRIFFVWARLAAERLQR